MCNLDGNQTRITTKTGTWQVTYNGENRPVLWSNGATNVVMSYDRMGRRVACDSDVDGAFTLESKRFSYNGYLLIHEERLATDLQPDAVACDYVWDPTEPVATLPLVFRTQSQSQLSPTILYYTHDGNKNVSELVAPNATVAAHYEYAPFGALTVSTGSCAFANPFRFSSEYADDVSELVYYNYRHYEPMMGRWLRRDPIGAGEYQFVANTQNIDFLGLVCCCKVCAYSAIGREYANQSPLSYDAGMSGHTWLQVESCDTDEVRWVDVGLDDVYSFGPKEANNSTIALIVGVDADYWEVEQYENLNKYKVVKKCWEQDEEQCKKIRDDIAAGYPETFSVWNYCTSQTISFLKEHGIQAPDGVGEVDVSDWIPNVQRSNPKDFADQLLAIGGHELEKVLKEYDSGSKKGGKK